MRSTQNRLRRGWAAVGALALAATLVGGLGPAATAAPSATDTVAQPAPAAAQAAPSAQLASWPSPKGSQKVNSTIKVSGTLDGGLKRYYGIGDGGQGESQDAMFELAAGATLKNVIIGAPAGDGVHCEGNCTLINVWWEDVGEDAATFRGGSAYTVDGGGARSASDKVFQHNGSGTVTIKNFQVENAGKLYRACGNCSQSFQRHVVLQNVTAKKVKSIVGINSNWGDTARFSNITVLDDKKKKTKICTRFEGVKKGKEPKELGSGPDSKHCLYKESDISWR
ncbi:pectate lyase [Micromonospora coxensis]|uniref:Pectate lyase n=1 Tax=Micromonospora coxensis TaxID=356852 RepID=A0A1C5GZH4_9ACTN|nr:pectate lyase [Micromonospora coxensis]SCG39083.1 Pectate lyase [Micromonospora coxensis]